MAVVGVCTRLERPLRGTGDRHQAVRTSRRPECSNDRCRIVRRARRTSRNSSSGLRLVCRTFCGQSGRARGRRGNCSIQAPHSSSCIYNRPCRPICRPRRLCHSAMGTLPRCTPQEVAMKAAVVWVGNSCSSRCTRPRSRLSSRPRERHHTRATEGQSSAACRTSSCTRSAAAVAMVAAGCRCERPARAAKGTGAPPRTRRRSSSRPRPSRTSCYCTFDCRAGILRGRRGSRSSQSRDVANCNDGHSCR